MSNSGRLTNAEAREAARAEAERLVHRHNAARKLQAVTRGKTVRRRTFLPKGSNKPFTISNKPFTIGAPPSSQTRRKKKRNKSTLKYRPQHFGAVEPLPLPGFLLGPQPRHLNKRPLFAPPPEPYRLVKTNYVQNNSKRRRTMGGKYKLRRKKSKSNKRKN